MNSIEKDKMLKEKFNGVFVSEFGKTAPEKTKLVVFDFDETLVQSKDVFHNINTEAMKRLNLNSDNDLASNIFVKFDKEYVGWGKDLEEQKQIYYSQYQPMITKVSNEEEFINQMKFYDGMKEVIKILAKTDIALAIASSRDLTSILKFLRKEGVKHCFEMIEATEGGLNYPDKPHPQIVNYISQELGIDLKNSVMIGDSPCDIRMGKNAGMKTIGIGYGKFSTREKLEKENPDRIVESSEPMSLIFNIQSLLDSKSR
ncbi:MAG: HAD family hydrolase [Alphaproteobacteria bacterium]|nr:HAD family hydrolase [Alphaproteobacteria bacterium]